MDRSGLSSRGTASTTGRRSEYWYRLGLGGKGGVARDPYSRVIPIMLTTQPLRVHPP